ncbi:methionine--tRNA ligase [Candidatus Auribacterota bacterium]
MTKKMYITTAIDYVNSDPHLGTSYEKIGADVLARFARIMGYETFFLMGADEHSLNVEKQAKSMNVSPQEYCDRMCEKFKHVWHRLNISFDDFIRTTEQRHINTVTDLFNRIHENGHIYSGEYKGWYCVSCEAFMKDKDLVDGSCPVHKKKPEWVVEKNYFLALSKFEDKLLHHIEKNKDFIRPEIRKNEMVNVIKGGLEDISVTRSSVGWGIPLPFDKTHVLYVWFDALINYLSGAGYSDNEKRFKRFWPADVHVIGKDITRFHCIIWPAMLMAAGIELPKSVFGHGFVYVEGGKMSKSEGRIVDPIEICDKYGADPLRYYLMREIPFDRDGDFTLESFENRYNADLANDLGNLVSRALSMVSKYRGGVIPVIKGVNKKDAELSGKVGELRDEIGGLVERLELSKILIKLWEFIQLANRYVEVNAPWALAKSKDDKRLDEVLYNLCEVIRLTSLYVFPFMPDKGREIAEQLGVEFDVENLDFRKAVKWGDLKGGNKIGKLSPLFPRLEKK